MKRLVDYIALPKEERALKTLCDLRKIPYENLINGDIFSFLALEEFFDKPPLTERDTNRLRKLHQRVEAGQVISDPDFFRHDYSLAKRRYTALLTPYFVDGLKLKFLDHLHRHYHSKWGTEIPRSIVTFEDRVQEILQDPILIPSTEWFQERPSSEVPASNIDNYLFDRWAEARKKEIEKILETVELTINEKEFRKFYGKDHEPRICEICERSEEHEPMDVLIRNSEEPDARHPLLEMICPECRDIPLNEERFKMLFSVDDYNDWSHNIYEAGLRFHRRFNVWPQILTANEATLHTIDLFMSKKLLAEKRVDEIKKISVFECSKFSLKICLDFELPNHRFALIHDEKARFGDGSGGDELESEFLPQ